MSKLSNDIEPSIKAFLEELNCQSGPELYELSVEDAREVLLNVQKVDVKILPADIDDRDVPGGPNGQVSLRIVRPKGNNELLPVVMYFHGGGWVLGDKNTHDRLIREIANGSHAAVVFVNFTPSPEAKYPVAIEEAYAATKYISESGNDLNLDTSRIVVAGDSVGGNMATVVAMMAKERGGPDILFQLLFYPVTDANFDTTSYQQFATHHFLTREAMKWFWDNYLPEEETRKEPTASPLQAPFDQLEGLPPALVINGEFDVLRDEGEAYAHKLIEAGVRVTAVRYLGTIHDFVMLNPITETPATRAAIYQANGMLREVFNGV
ncbi:MAG: alpha/beta hydrolase [Methanobacteriaceae archaeon]